MEAFQLEDKLYVIVLILFYSKKYSHSKGNYEQGAEALIGRWLLSGYKIGIEIDSLCGHCEMLTSLPLDSQKPRGSVKLAAYQCKD